MQDIKLTNCNIHSCLVNVKHQGAWGTVCSRGITSTAANLICKELGYPKSKMVGRAGGGTGSIWLDRVSCTGNEVSITMCSHRRWGRTHCGHNQVEICPVLQIMVISGLYEF